MYSNSTRRWWFLLVILVALGIVIWDMAQPKFNPQVIQDQVKAALEQNDISRAEKILEDAIQKRPDYLQGRVDLARLYMMRSRFLEAQDQMTVCVEKSNRDPNVLALQAQLWEEMRLFELAYRVYPEILQKVPDMIPAHLRYFPLLFAKGEIEAATKEMAFLKANEAAVLSEFPQFPDLEADWLMYLLRFVEAKQAYERLLEKIPWLFDAQRDWIECNEILGTLPEAREKYQQKVQTTQEDEQFFYQQLYALTLPIPEAIVYLEKLLTVNPKPPVRMALVSLAIRNGDYAKALDQCRQLQILGPEIAQRQQAWLAHALFLIGKLEESQTISEALAQSGSNSGVTGLIHIALAQKKYPEALDYVQKLQAPYVKSTLWNIELKKELVYYQTLEARIYYESRDFATAQQKIQTILSTSQGWPYHWHGQFILGQIYLSTQEYNKAAEVFSKIAESGIRAPSLRLRAGIWHGIALYLGGQDPTSVWQVYAEIPWQNYTADAREADYLQLLLGKKPLSECATIEPQPLMQNDHCLYVAIYYERAGQKESALAAYRKGIETSIGQEFPQHLLQERAALLNK